MQLCFPNVIHTLASHVPSLSLPHIVSSTMPAAVWVNSSASTYASMGDIGARLPTLGKGIDGEVPAFGNGAPLRVP